MRCFGACYFDEGLDRGVEFLAEELGLYGFLGAAWVVGRGMDG